MSENWSKLQDSVWMSVSVLALSVLSLVFTPADQHEIRLETLDTTPVMTKYSSLDRILDRGPVPSRSATRLTGTNDIRWCLRVSEGKSYSKINPEIPHWSLKHVQPHQRCLYKETNVSGEVVSVITSRSDGFPLVESQSSGYCPHPIGLFQSTLTFLPNLY